MNQKKTICTIITKSFIPWARALYLSINTYSNDINLKVLIYDVPKFSIDKTDIDKNIEYIFLEDINSIDIVSKLVQKYNRDKERLRWVLKAPLIKYLIEKRNFDKVIYCDSDIQFFNTFDFFWKKLDYSGILITPHWVNIYSSAIDILHNKGIFNAGFLGASKAGLPQIDWLAKSCLRQCKKDPFTYHDDQGFFDLLPVYFTNTEVLNHKGCNVGHWSKDYLIREERNGEFIVQDEHKNEFPIIFYHFARSTFFEFIYGKEKVIYKLLEILIQRLEFSGYKKDLLADCEKKFKQKIKIRKRANTLSKIKEVLPFGIYKK